MYVFALGIGHWQSGYSKVLLVTHVVLMKQWKKMLFEKQPDGMYYEG